MLISGHAQSIELETVSSAQIQWTNFRAQFAAPSCNCDCGREMQNCSGLANAKRRDARSLSTREASSSIFSRDLRTVQCEAARCESQTAASNWCLSHTASSQSAHLGTGSLRGQPVSALEKGDISLHSSCNAELASFSPNSFASPNLRPQPNTGPNKGHFRPPIFPRSTGPFGLLLGASWALRAAGLRARD